MINKKVLGILILILLASSILSANAASSVKVTTKAKIDKQFNFMSDLLSTLKIDGVSCTSYEKNPQVLGVREEGTCNFNKQSITIDIFPDEKSGKAIINIIKGLAGGYVIGLNNWALFVGDEATAKILINGLRLKLY